MIKNYIYNGRIDEDFTKFVAASLNENSENRNPICFVLSSGGGYTDDKDAVLFMLNSALNYHNISIVAKDKVYSAAFDLVLGFNGRVFVLPDTFGMMHLSTFTETVNSSGISDDDKYLKLAKDVRNRDIQNRDYVFIEYLTQEEKDDYIQGKPIYFHTERTKEIILSERAKRGLS